MFLGFIVFNLLMNAGPNSFTFLLPAHLYPTSGRATGAGFTATSGKLGGSLAIFLLLMVMVVPLHQQSCPLDLAYLRSLEGTFAEWSCAADDEAFANP